jgi:hypothetical protein
MSSKNRVVTCTVINNTSYDLTYLTDSSQKGESGSNNGQFSYGPAQTLNAGESNEAFSVQRSSNVSLVGSTGWVSYNLNNSQGQIYLMYNNPYSYDGNGDSGNCWFYASIQSLDGEVLGVSPTVYAEVSGFDFNVSNPTNEDTMTITVTLNHI